jgi:hypothetical protein
VNEAQIDMNRVHASVSYTLRGALDCVRCPSCNQIGNFTPSIEEEIHPESPNRFFSTVFVCFCKQRIVGMRCEIPFMEINMSRHPEEVILRALERLVLRTLEHTKELDSTIDISNTPQKVTPKVDLPDQPTTRMVIL